jgi:hypothetical protein
VYLKIIVTGLPINQRLAPIRLKPLFINRLFLTVAEDHGNPVIAKKMTLYRNK